MRLFFSNRIKILRIYTKNWTPELLIRRPKLWTNPFYYVLMCPQTAGWVANSVDPDQKPRYAASDLGLRCLLWAVCPNVKGYYGRPSTVTSTLTLSMLDKNFSGRHFDFYFIHYFFLKYIPQKKVVNKLFFLRKKKKKNQGPVVQSVVSLTSSLRVISLTVLADSIYNILIFFAEKCE